MNLKAVTISNIKWAFIESISLKAVTFVLGIILARLLSPEAFGILAIVNVFYLLTTIFVDGGLKESLIRKKNATYNDYSTLFWLNIGMACFLYIILFISAPFIQSYYGFDNLSLYIRLQSLTLIIESFGLIQIVKAVKELKLKKITQARIPASLISFGIGISLAYIGYGILALIVQQLVNVTLYTIFLIINVKYRPALVFNVSSIKSLYKFGLKLIGVVLLSRFYTQSLNLIYAKFYTPAILGLFTKANSIQNMPIEIINAPFLKGLYPTLVTLQDNNQHLKKIVLQNIRLVTFLMLVVNGIFFFQSHEIIEFLLGEKWLGLDVYIKIASVGSVFLPMNGQCQSIFKVKDSIGLFLKVEVISKIIGLITILSLIFFLELPSILWLIASFTILTSCVYFYLTSKILEFSFFKKIFPIFFLCLFHGSIGFAIDNLISIYFTYPSNIIKIILFSFLYCSCVFLFFYSLNRKEIKDIFKKEIKHHKI